MKTLDCRGLECPLPVVKTKEALKNEDGIKVLVDNEIAVQNILKFAKVKGFNASSGSVDNDYFVVVSNGEMQADCPTCQLGPTVVVSSAVMGSNPELGKILMKSFIFALTKQDVMPSQIIFYNEGVYLTCAGSDVLLDLKTLEDQGTEIVSCGTCLDFFGLKEALQIGSITNMYDIVERMESAVTIIRP